MLNLLGWGSLRLTPNSSSTSPLHPHSHPSRLSSTCYLPGVLTLELLYLSLCTLPHLPQGLLQGGLLLAGLLRQSVFLLLDLSVQSTSLLLVA